MVETSRKLLVAIISFVLAAVCGSIALFLPFDLGGAFGFTDTQIGVERAVFFGPMIALIAMIAAISGWRSAENATEHLKSNWRASMFLRMIVIFPIAWIVAVVSYIALFEPEPFSNGLSELASSDRYLVLKILVIPPFVLSVLVGALLAILGKQKASGGEKPSLRIDNRDDT